jgi:hypothetical protein
LTITGQHCAEIRVCQTAAGDADCECSAARLIEVFGKGEDCMRLVHRPARPSRPRCNRDQSAFPAKAGTHRSAGERWKGWTPAFAGEASYLNHFVFCL